jgi:pimeloyl-ACP methyl ester carboxylesterase
MTLAADHQISLQDGRLLGYREIGAPQGKPVFYFHGFPGSRLEVTLAEKLAHELGIKLIGVDRPGYGLSHYQTHRTLPDWPKDIAALADSLGIPRFTVIGVSGGGPYAASCAWKIPERLRSVGIVSGLGPLRRPGALEEMPPINRWGLLLTMRAPFLAGFLFRIAAFVLRNLSGHVVRHVAGKVKEPDREFLNRNETAHALANSFRESVRQGFRGPYHDLILYSRPWGFRLEDISTPVHLWHGMLDVIVPPAMGQDMAGAIPQCRSFFFEDEGHFSLLLNRFQDILHTLITRSAD